jgi:hypothetical protein
LDDRRKGIVTQIARKFRGIITFEKSGTFDGRTLAATEEPAAVMDVRRSSRRHDGNGAHGHA